MAHHPRSLQQPEMVLARLPFPLEPGSQSGGVSRQACDREGAAPTQDETNLSAEVSSTRRQQSTMINLPTRLTRVLCIIKSAFFPALSKSFSSKTFCTWRSGQSSNPAPIVFFCSFTLLYFTLLCSSVVEYHFDPDYQRQQNLSSAPNDAPLAILRRTDIFWQVYGLAVQPRTVLGTLN